MSINPSSVDANTSIATLNENDSLQTKAHKDQDFIIPTTKTKILTNFDSKRSYGMALLRLIATLASGFILTVWIIFAIQCLLFLFMNVVGTYTPTQWTSHPPVYLLGCIIACPLLLDSLALILTMSWACTVDCWRGMSSHPSSLWKTNTVWLGRRTAEWLFRLFFFHIPLLAAGIAILMDIWFPNDKIYGDDKRSSDEENNHYWYQWTILLWAGSVWIFQIIYMELCLWNEIISCHGLLKQYKKTKSIFEALRTNLLLTQRQKYSGWKREGFRTTSSAPEFHDPSASLSTVELGVARDEPDRSIVGFGARLTQRLPWCFDKLDEEHDDHQHPRPAMADESEASTQRTISFGTTTHNKPPEKLPSRPKRMYTTEEILGNPIVSTRDEWTWKCLGCKVTATKPETRNENERIVWQSVRITELREWACYAMAAIEITFLFGWPLISLLAYENWPMGIVFMLFGIHEIPRHYFNPSPLLQELGSLDHLDLGRVDLSLPPWCASTATDETTKLRNHALLANLLRRVTRSQRGKNWIRPLFYFFLFFFVGCCIASREEIPTNETERFHNYGYYRFADGFSWNPAGRQLKYPTCAIDTGISFPGSVKDASSSLADYAFLSLMAYSSHEESQPLLDQWFGPSKVVDDYEFVQNYRDATHTQHNPVAYKIFAFDGNDGEKIGIVGIRGTERSWDWVADAQQWLGGFSVQVIKSLHPFGYLLDPILDDIVAVVNVVQSQKLKEVSFYQRTTEFVRELLSVSGGYTHLSATGHSLGGGVATLTGATTHIPAVSFSGVNSVYSRKTFRPSIARDDLDDWTLNVMPEGDWVSRVDKPSRLHEEIRCTASGPHACHDIERTLCEIQYRCGSHHRPIHCRCVSEYGYPAPTPDDGTEITWEEACFDSS